MPTRSYSKFPLKIYEIILTTFLINSVLSVSLTMMETTGVMGDALSVSTSILIPVFYLILIYKVLLENEVLLSKSLFRYMIYLISACAIFLSFAMLEEIIPIFRESELSSSEFYSRYSECLYYHLLTIVVLNLFLVIYWIAYNRNRSEHYDLVFCLTYFLIGSMFSYRYLIRFLWCHVFEKYILLVWPLSSQYLGFTIWIIVFVVILVVAVNIESLFDFVLNRPYSVLIDDEE